MDEREKDSIHCNQNVLGQSIAENIVTLSDTKQTTQLLVIRTLLTSTLKTFGFIRIFRRRLRERHSVSKYPLVCYSIHKPSPPFKVISCSEGLDQNQVETHLSSEMNRYSIFSVMAIMYVCEDPVVNVSILLSFYNSISLPLLV